MNINVKASINNDKLLYTVRRGKNVEKWINGDRNKIIRDFNAKLEDEELMNPKFNRISD